MFKKIIPCLDTMNGRVVKGVRFVDLADIGDPLEIALQYEQQGADEIVFLDIAAAYEGKESMYTLLENAAGALKIPIILGGGIRTMDDFRKAFNSGASKVSVNSAAVTHPQLITEASAAYGKERVIAAIDFSGRDVYIKGGREKTGLDVVAWAVKCEALGAGELLVTSISSDGAQQGYDTQMTQIIVDSVSIPVIASGGCGSIDDIIHVFMQTDCAAALVASLFHYGKATVDEVKQAMERNHILCKRLKD
jgi:cyclase